MFKSIAVIFSLVAVASSGLVVPQPRIACDECVREMHNIAAVIRQFADDIEVTEFNAQKHFEVLTNISGIPESRILPSSCSRG